MINLLIAAARIALELAAPTEVTIGRAIASRAFRRSSVRAIQRSIAGRGAGFIRRGRMGILQTVLGGIKRGGAAPTAEIAEPPTRILPPAPTTAPDYPVPREMERINVPPGAFPQTPIPNVYFGGPQYTQMVFNSNTNVSPGPNPPAQKEPIIDRQLNNLWKADVAANLVQRAYQLMNDWFPSMMWSGTVQATGFKTTPTRTVVHYALAVAFGLIKQTRVSDVTLQVDVDYETNHVTVHYVSKSTILTELLTLGIYSINGAAFPPEITKDITALQGKTLDALSRSLTSGFITGSTPGIIELGKQGIQLAGDALKLVIKSYQNLGRLLGPLGVYDIGDETLYGGRASALLRSPIQPQPFASMISDSNGKPVPLLTRLPAPNPQPPVAPQTDPSSGYSLDLRSLVAQALHDPGVCPPVPDTNVSLPSAA